MMLRNVQIKEAHSSCLGSCLNCSPIPIPEVIKDTIINIVHIITFLNQFIFKFDNRSHIEY